MSRAFYDHRINVEHAFCWNKMNFPFSEAFFMKFLFLICAGFDEGWSVFKNNIQTEETLRIIFNPLL